jgi:uncharacterized surface protein with fasciclin (FAS1) repeats
MNKIRIILAVTVLGLMCHVGFAQQTSNTLQDTVRAAAYRQGKVKLVSGVAMNSGRDVVYNFSQSQNYSIFINAIRNAGLTETIKSRGPITVFVPDNSAFGILPPGRMDTLMKPNHLLELVNLISYHMVPGNLKAKDIAKLIKDGNGQAVLITVAGGKLTAHIDTNRNIVLVDENGGESIISTFDIPQNNGTAHLVTKVLLPKYKVI